MVYWDQFLEIIFQKSGSIVGGICGALFAMILLNIMRNLRGNRAVVRAGRENSSTAKSALPPDGMAAVLIFRDQAVGSAKGTDLSVDGRSVGQLRGKAFYRLDLAPGEHVVTSAIPGSKAADLKISLSAGQQFYIRDRFRMGAVRMTNSLESVTKGEGVSALSKCRLLECSKSGEPWRP